MLHQLIHPKNQTTRRQTLINQYISSVRLKTNKKFPINTLIPTTKTSLNSSKIKSLMTESVMTSESAILVSNTFLESNSKISILEKSNNNTSLYQNRRIITNSKDRSKRMFKNELEAVEMLFNEYNMKTNENLKDAFNLEKYHEIVKLIEHALNEIKLSYQGTLHKEQYQDEEWSLSISNPKVNEITHKLYLGLFTEVFNSMSIIPNYIDRYYIKLKSLPQITVCFLKPLLVKIFSYNISLNKEEFISICFKIYSKMTLNEKAKFIDAYKLNK